MRNRIVVSIMLCGASVLAGCASPKAQLSSYQDSAHPISKQSKIAMGTPPADVPSRQALDELQAQMRTLSFNLVPSSDADFTIRCEETTKDAVIGSKSGARLGVGGGEGFGTGDGFGIAGVGLSMPLGKPKTETQQFTYLNITIETANDPKLAVWQGNISAAKPDAEKYRSNFFKLPLLHVGDNFSGEVPLDKLPTP